MLSRGRGQTLNSAVPTTPTESLTLDPAPARWIEWSRSPASRVPAWMIEPARRFRSQLGLPEGPLVMSGHQALLWHPGILAKYIAAGACAASVGGSAAWVVVDQDTPAPDEIAIPVRAGPSRTAIGSLRFAYASPCDTEVPASMRPVLLDERPTSSPQPHNLEELDRAINRVRSSITEHAQSPNAAAQITRVIETLLPVGVARVPAFFATSIARTDLFAAAVRRMADNPRACVDAYNAAAIAHPEADIRSLDADSLELPLWRIVGKPGHARRIGVLARDLADTHPQQLAPRALLMTALLRLAACDLFIHGTGGAAYDRVTDRWLAAWLGPETRPAPTAMATATLLLPLAPTPEAEAIAAQRAFRDALHKPASLGDAVMETQRRKLVATIAASPYRSRQRASLYRDLQHLLAAHRESHTTELDELRSRAQSARRSASDRAASVRTWAFPLYPEALLARLRDRINDSFSIPATAEHAGGGASAGARPLTIPLSDAGGTQ